MTPFMSLVCQYCKSPLGFENLKELNRATFNLVVGSLKEKRKQVFYEEEEEEENIPLLFPESRKKYYNEAINRLISELREDEVEKEKDCKNISYILFEDEYLKRYDTLVSDTFQLNDIEGRFHEAATFEHLFHNMSFLSDARHPICSECCEKQLNNMSKHLEHLKNERDAYIGILNHINDHIFDNEEIEKIKMEIEDNLKKEAVAVKTITQLRKKQQDIEKEVKKLEEESLILDKEEEIFWKKRNLFLLKLQEFQNERDALNLQYDYNIKQLEELEETNVYKDIFCISHDGQFGTINDLKFGRLPSYPANWDEINAAWGLIVLSLHSIAKKLNFKFSEYKLNPLGSTSTIHKLELHTNSSYPSKSISLELYNSDHLLIKRFFMQKKFDIAMISFLACLKQIGDHLKQIDSSFKFPYKIQKDKIGNATISISFNPDEIWTRSLKYLLTNLKYIIAYTTRRSS
ncbi:hypothetical protein T552_00447 [Pneumocystis carinii B80]|uniref:Uncharacterized protein n=1 Tax=Pneumocystis carinii (strain B80) TaxID=1408658 RepID=A0A0W4ZQU1_PNEC8|nr:hypothetical protein T552_00447 [Pneumocystis carinii B80]KTW30735.1 hypothetical protein T552_00447 [Pneumocystis carinii B80]